MPNTVVLGQHVVFSFYYFLAFWFQNTFCYMGGGQDQWDRRSRSIQPEAKTNRAVRGQGQKLGARIHRTADRANSETNINQKTKTRKPTQPRQIPRPHTVVLGQQHVGFLFFGFSGCSTHFVTWAEVSNNGTGGQGQYSLKPKQGWCGARAKSWGPGSTGRQTGPIQKPT